MWIERTLFRDGVANNMVGAGKSRVLDVDVWYNAGPSGLDVPDDLTLALGYELY